MEDDNVRKTMLPSLSYESRADTKHLARSFSEKNRAECFFLRRRPYSKNCSVSEHNARILRGNSHNSPNGQKPCKVNYSRRPVAPHDTKHVLFVLELYDMIVIPRPTHSGRMICLKQTSHGITYSR